MESRTEERSLGQLLTDLQRQFTTLVRQEVELAKTEMTQKATRVGKDIAFLVAGGAVAYAGLLGILAAIAIGLGQLGVPWWLATLIVGVVVAAIGGFLVMRGLSNLRRETPLPQQTIETLKEDAEWAKAQTQ